MIEVVITMETEPQSKHDGEEKIVQEAVTEAEASDRLLHEVNDDSMTDQPCTDPSDTTHQHVETHQSSDDEVKNQENKSNINHEVALADQDVRDSGNFGVPTAETVNDPEMETGAEEKSPDETACIENRPEDKDEDDASEEYTLEEFGDPHLMTLIARTKLFAKGQDYQQAAKRTMALKCYLRCLKGLEQTNGFTSLPQCLRNIADIYYAKGEFAKAIQFIQAEKLYYESALIDASQLARHLEEQVSGGDEEHPDKPQINPEIVRADEYEKLAKVCLEKKQPQLALEYQAKATKLRQKLLGDDHPITVESLDFFTVVYAEVGKIQYSESMKKMTSATAATGASESQETKMADLSAQDDSQLRNRKTSNGDGASAASEAPEAHQTAIRDQEEWISRSLMLVLFAFCVMLVLVTGFLLYCKLIPHSSSCRSFKRELHYYYMLFKYRVYYYIFPSNTYG